MDHPYDNTCWCSDCYLTCQICRRRDLVDVEDEHFGLRCATCPFPRLYGHTSFFNIPKINYEGCQSFHVPSLGQYGPDLKDDDPEVISGRYVAGEKRYRMSTEIYHFCLSSPEAIHLQGQREWGRTNHRRTLEPPEVQWEGGHTYRTWNVCKDCRELVQKSIRRYGYRLFKEYELREKEYYYQRAALREGGQILTDIKRLLKEKKKMQL